MSFTRSCSNDVPPKTLEVPQQFLFDHSLSSFQDFSFNQDFDLAEFNADSTTFGDVFWLDRAEELEPFAYSVLSGMRKRSSKNKFHLEVEIKVFSASRH